MDLFWKHPFSHTIDTLMDPRDFRELAINPPPRSSTPIGPMPERIEEIERDFDKVVSVHPHRDVRLDNNNYYKTYQDYQYRPHCVKGRDPSTAKDAHFIENTVSLFNTFVLSPRETEISSWALTLVSQEVFLVCLGKFLIQEDT